MTTLFVSRHSGAVQWAARRGIAAQRVAHLEPEAVSGGMVVVGTLPVNLIADINRRGARYLHLVMDVPFERRGDNLTADEMDGFGARLEEYRAERVG